MGDGSTLKSDLESFLKDSIPHDVMAIARSFKQYNGNILHWAMVDSEANRWWAEHLPLMNNDSFPIRHTLGECDGFDVNWDDGQEDGALWHGTSALFATLVALNLGYEKIILAGCPMDLNGHWYFPDETGPYWKKEDYEIWREFAKTEESKKVSSLSGFTKEVLS
jgi:hypothetical protein